MLAHRLRRWSSIKSTLLHRFVFPGDNQWRERAEALVQWLKVHAWKVGDRGIEPTLAFKCPRNKMFLPRSLVKIHYCAEPP